MFVLLKIIKLINVFYILANNLYGVAQSMPLPISQFRWLKRKEFKKIDWQAQEVNQKTGYIVEVSLEYPEELHKLHNSFPVAAEQLNITGDMLSPFSQDCKTILTDSNCDNYKSKKLTSTFNNRIRYVCHYTNLKLYLNLGLKIIKVHKCMGFHQSDYLKSYIDLCARKRKESDGNFGKTLWKNFANCVFGKTIERIRDYLDCKLVTNEDNAKKWITSPRFTSMKIINENLVAIFCKRIEVTLNKPLFMGFTILEHSKRFMYETFYFEILPKIHSARVLFTDTDSLLLSCESNKPQSNINKLKHMIDFSNYDKSHKKYSNKNANALGYWKDELRGQKMSHFVGLRSKTHAFLIKDDDGKEHLHTKCKGVCKGYRKKITFGDYVKCVHSITDHHTVQYHIQSRNHQIRLSKVRKLCYSSFDDKRFMAPCNVHTLAFGSKYIKKSLRKYLFCPECKWYGNPLS